MTASTKSPPGYCHGACGIQKVLLKKKAGDSKHVVRIKKMMNIGYQTVSRVNELSNPRGPAPPKIRPLSGYNFFFKYARVQILHSHNLDVDGIFSSEMAPLPPPQEYFNTADPHLRDKVDKKSRNHRKTHGKLGFVALSKEVSAQWRVLPLKEKDFFRNLAKNDRKRYLKEKARYDGVLNINNNAKYSFKVPSVMEESEHYDGVCGGWIAQNNNCIPTVSTVFNMKNGPLLSELWSSTTPTNRFKSTTLNSTTKMKNYVLHPIEKYSLGSSVQDNFSFGPQTLGKIPKESRKPFEERELDCPPLTIHALPDILSTSHIPSSLLEKSNAMPILITNSLAMEMGDNGNDDRKIKLCEPTPIEFVLAGTEFSSFELQFLRDCF